jgi:hypothetical protein
VGADQLVELGIEDQLDQALGMPDRLGLAAGGEGEATDLELAALGERLLLGQPERGDLGIWA